MKFFKANIGVLCEQFTSGALADGLVATVREIDIGAHESVWVEPSAFDGSDGGEAEVALAATLPPNSFHVAFFVADCSSGRMGIVTVVALAPGGSA